MELVNYLLVAFVVYVLYTRVVKGLINNRFISRLRVEASSIKSEPEYLEFCRKQHKYFVYLSPRLRVQLSNNKFDVFTKRDLRYRDIYLMMDDLKVMKFNDLIGLVTIFRRVYFKSPCTVDKFLVVGYLSRDNMLGLLKSKDTLSVIKSNFDSNYCFVDKANQLSSCDFDSAIIDFSLLDDVSFLDNLKLKSLRLKNVTSKLDLMVECDVLIVERLTDLSYVSDLFSGVKKLIVTAPEFEILDFGLLSGVSDFEFYKTKFTSFTNIDVMDRSVRFILNGAYLNHGSLKLIVNYFDKAYFSNVFKSKTTNLKIDDQVDVAGVRYLICGLHIVDGRFTYDYGCRRADYGDSKIYLFNHGDVEASYRRMFGDVRFNESDYDDFVDYYSVAKRRFKRDVSFKVIDPSIKLSLKFFIGGCFEGTKGVCNFYNMSFYENAPCFCYNGISSASEQFLSFVEIERAFINKVLQAGLVDTEILIALERFYLQVSHYSFTKIRMLFFFTIIKRSFWISDTFSMHLSDCDLSVLDKCRCVLIAYGFYFGGYTEASYELLVAGRRVTAQVVLGDLVDAAGVHIKRDDVSAILF